MSEFRVNSITNQDGSAGPQGCGVSTFSRKSGVQIPSGSSDFRRQDGGGRGRVIFSGGGTPTIVNTIDTIEIATLGNAVDFGDLPRVTVDTGSFASATRGFTAGGYDPGYLSAIDFVVFSSGGGGNEFGNLDTGTWGINCLASSTRGIMGGGRANPSNGGIALYNGGYLDRMVFVETSSDGQDASRFGDLIAPQDKGLTIGQTINLTMATFASPTRGVFCGGGTPRQKFIQFITIATKGDSQDFGNLTEKTSRASGLSNSTRGIIAGGFHDGSPASVRVNVIEFVTIATLGDATDFGDLTNARYQPGEGASATRGVVAGGVGTPTFTNIIDFITISTAGNATDFGDLSTVRRTCGSSDAHGGLAQ